jgi:hypothetical protein
MTHVVLDEVNNQYTPEIFVMHHYEIVMQIAMLSLGCYQILLSAFSGNPNHHTRDLAEYTQDSFSFLRALKV